MADDPMTTDDAPLCLACGAADLKQVQGGGDFEVWRCRRCSAEQIYDHQDGTWVASGEDEDAP